MTGGQRTHRDARASLEPDTSIFVSLGGLYLCVTGAAKLCGRDFKGRESGGGGRRDG